MYEPFEIEFEQTQLTCSDNNAENGQNAIVVATAKSDIYNSFTYQWQNVPYCPNPNTAMGLMAWREYEILVTNENGCVQTGTFMPVAYPNPKIEISKDPGDTIYIQNPFASFSFENMTDSIEVTNFFWEFWTTTPHRQLKSQEKHIRRKESSKSVSPSPTHKVATLHI